MTATLLLLGAAASCASICLAQGATAQTPTPAVLPPSEAVGARLPSVRVSYRDLDVRGEPGRRALAGRISSAARLVCWQGDFQSDLEFVYSCRDESRRSAWAQFERQQQRAQFASGPQLAAIIVRPAGD